MIQSALETTLANLSLAPRLRELRERGYRAYLFFFYAPSPEFCIARVAARVRRGGHDIPEATIRRRWRTGLQNLVGLYAPLVDEWCVIRNTGGDGPQPVAWKDRHADIIQGEPDIWSQIQVQATSR